MDENTMEFWKTVVGITVKIGLVGLGAVGGYLFKVSMFKKQKAEEIITEAVAFLNESIHEINHFVHTQDREQFSKVFQKGNHFPRLDSIRFKLLRVGEEKITQAFDVTYKSFSELGGFVDMRGGNVPADERGRLNELMSAFSVAKKEFESRCAGYLKIDE